MAQINITLDQEEILQLLCDDRDEAFRQLLQNSLNSVLKAESAEQLKAAPYERSEKRTDSRNGSRQRRLATRIGSITLEVPRHRNVPFRTMIFDNYSRSEAALIACMAEMVVNGVSTRKVAKVVETLCGETYTKSTVSELCKELDEKVEEFRNRPLEGHYPFIEVDATYFKVREKHRFISKAFMIAYGVNEYGIREILGFDVCHSETKETWNTFLKSLKKRGLSGLLMITSDAHEGIIDAVTKQYPGVPWQRGLRTELHEMFNSKTMEAARKKRDSIISDYRDVAEAAVECLDEGFEDAMTVMILPHGMRRFLRTSNHIERLNKELKRRSKALGVFPNDRSVIRLMGAVLMERNDELQLQRAIFDNKTYASLIESEAPRKLIVVAEQQRRQAA